jgi:hypothetical protein
MRWVEQVGVWPVGLTGGLFLQRPKVEDGKVVGWLTAINPRRKFALDMAGFAVGISHFFTKENFKFRFDVGNGNQETFFVSLFADSLDELEPKADNCTKV